MTNYFFRAACLTLPLVCISHFAVAGPTSSENGTVSFDISAQPIGDALSEFAQQANLDLVFYSDLVDNIRATRLTGSYTPEAALTRLLAATPLRASFLDQRTVAIRMAEVDAATPVEAGKSTDTPTEAPGNSTQRPAEGRETSDAAASTAPLAEVVVTGSHIRGSQPVGAQLITINRADIEKTGLATVQQVVNTLPQNFRGDVRTDAILTSGSREGATNSSEDAGLNLRGLGSGSTLVLMNGRRLAPGGTSGSFTGVSGIPLTAIERIEVLPDGASALYGSDAVGGVVNIITRKDFQGAQTSARYGDVTSGSFGETQIGEALGEHWETGNAMLSAEYYHRSPFAASDRSESQSDLTSLGGGNFDTNQCNPGTISVGGKTYAIPAGQNGTGLTAANFTAGTQNLCDRNTGSDLFGAQRRWSALGTLQQLISERLTLFIDGSFSDRRVAARNARDVTALSVPRSNAFYVNPSGGTGPVTVQYNFNDDLGPYTNDTDVKDTNASIGAAFQIGRGWALTGSAGLSRETQDQLNFALVDPVLLKAALADGNPATALNPFGDGSNTNPATLDTLRHSEWSTFNSGSKMLLLDVIADGPLFDLPGGTAKLAVGSDVRREAFDSRTTQATVSSSQLLFNQSQSLSRTVTAAFGEVLLPLMGGNSRRTGLERLELSAAGRYERYSDFGSAAVPRVGLLWIPFNSVSVRSSWSKSYKAPNLADLSDGNNISYVTATPDPRSPSRSSNALIWSGSNANLTPEKATVWTAGLDFSPPAVPKLSLGATYLNINYKNRIDLLPNKNYLSDPIDAAGVTLNPTAAERQVACSRSSFLGNFSVNPGTCLTAPIDVLLDIRLRNVAALQERGVDFRSNYGLTAGRGEVNLGLNGTYLFNFSRQVTPQAALADQVSTATNPIDLKLRGSAQWSTSAYAVTAFVNYANHYEDTISVPHRAIASWTTFDLNLAYRPNSGSGLFHGLQVSLSAQNLFDRPPPFFNNSLGFGYDLQNGDIVGRFVSLYVAQKF